MSLPTVTVAGTISAPDGRPVDGKRVSFTTTAEMVDAVGNVLVPILTVRAKVVGGQLFDSDGVSPLILFASNTGVSTVPYEVRESWSTRKFTVNLLTTMVTAGHIAYSTLGPVGTPPVASDPYVLLAAYRATVTSMQAQIDQLTSEVAALAAVLTPEFSSYPSLSLVPSLTLLPKAG